MTGRSLKILKKVWHYCSICALLLCIYEYDTILCYDVVWRCDGAVLTCTRKLTSSHHSLSHNSSCMMIISYTVQSLFYVIIIITIQMRMFMVLSSWQSHCESSPGPFDECRTAPSGRRPKTKPDDLGFESACTGCQSLHPPSLFIIITKPERGYSFQGGWKAESTKLAGYIPRWFTRPQTRHPSWY